MILLGSKTICIKEEVFNKLNELKSENESYSDFFSKIIPIISNTFNNHKIVMNKFGFGKNLLSDELIADIKSLRNESNDDFDLIGDIY